MKLSRRQKMLLHTAAQQAGAEEEIRRMVQRNVGGFHSAADATVTREGFIAVMAFWEDQCGGRLTAFTAGYWRGQADQARPGDTLRWHARRLAGLLGWTPEDLDSFVASEHGTAGQFRRLADCDAPAVARIVEGLKAIAGRSAPHGPPRVRADDYDRPGPGPVGAESVGAESVGAESVGASSVGAGIAEEVPF